jgi:tetratricopeptide (TPR) repeat protein
MQHPELFPLGMIFMILSAVAGLWLGRRITSWRWYLAALALALAGGWSVFYFRRSVDLGVYPFLFLAPMFFFALAMGANTRATDDRRRVYLKRCLDAQLKQLGKDQAHFNQLVAAETLTAIAELYGQLGQSEKAVDCYGKAAAIFETEKGGHPSLTRFYLASAQAHRRVGRNLDADQLTARAKACALQVEY